MRLYLHQHHRRLCLETLEPKKLTASILSVSLLTADGPVPIESDDLVELGDVPFGSTPVMLFQIDSSGDESLETSGISWPDRFWLSNGITRILAPSESDTFSLVFDNFTLGPTGELPVTLRTNDPNNGSFTFFVSANRTFEFDALLGDFNNDRQVNVDDVHLLQNALNAGNVDTFFDVSDDGNVDDVDLRYLVVEIIGSHPGDTDLDQDVDFNDFLTLSGNFGNDDMRWFDGNFDSNTVVDFADFLALSGNFGFSTP